VPNVVDLASGTDAAAPAGPDDGQATSPAVWVLVAAGAVAMGAILRRELGTRP
jgi:hypothetical protein